MTKEKKREIAFDVLEKIYGKEIIDSFKEWEKNNEEVKREVSRSELLNAISRGMTKVFGSSAINDYNLHEVASIIISEIFDKEEESNGKTV